MRLRLVALAVLAAAVVPVAAFGAAGSTTKLTTSLTGSAEVPKGAANGGGTVLGTNLHGLMEEDGFRAALLTEVASRRGRRFVAAGVSFAGARQTQQDRLADLVEAHLDMAAVEKLIMDGSP